MSLTASFPAPILNTVLDRLGPLFVIGAGGDTAAARDAAAAMLASYDVRTEPELSLAADVISFGFHGLEALSQSMTDDMPLNKIIRLRGSAVSLHRESHRSRQKLEQLQRDRRAGLPSGLPLAQPEIPAPAPAAAAPVVMGPSRAEQAVELVEIAREAIKIAGGDKKQGKYGGMTYTQMLQKRMTAKRMVEKAKRKAAEDNARIAKAQAGVPGGRCGGAPVGEAGGTVTAAA